MNAQQIQNTYKQAFDLHYLAGYATEVLRGQFDANSNDMLAFFTSKKKRLNQIMNEVHRIRDMTRELSTNPAFYSGGPTQEMVAEFGSQLRAIDAELEATKEQFSHLGPAVSASVPDAGASTNRTLGRGGPNQATKTSAPDARPTGDARRVRVEDDPRVNAMTQVRLKAAGVEHVDDLFDEDEVGQHGPIKHHEPYGPDNNAGINAGEKILDRIEKDETEKIKDDLMANPCFSASHEEYDRYSAIAEAVSR